MFKAWPWGAQQRVWWQQAWRRDLFVFFVWERVWSGSSSLAVANKQQGNQSRSEFPVPGRETLNDQKPFGALDKVRPLHFHVSADVHVMHALTVPPRLLESASAVVSSGPRGDVTDDEEVEVWSWAELWPRTTQTRWGDGLIVDNRRNGAQADDSGREREVLFESSWMRFYCVDVTNQLLCWAAEASVQAGEGRAKLVLPISFFTG